MDKKALLKTPWNEKHKPISNKALANCSFTSKFCIAKDFTFCRQIQAAVFEFYFVCEVIWCLVALGGRTERYLLVFMNATPTQMLEKPLQDFLSRIASKPV